MNNERLRIPIFFASDESYLPYMAVTVKSIIDHSSSEYIYDIRVLTDGFSTDGVNRLKSFETDNVSISVVDVNDVVSQNRGQLKIRLRDYYSEAIYYRLYIAGMFPELNRAIYIDCDVVLVDDIAKLYFLDIEDNIIGAVADESIPGVPQFREYVEQWLGVGAREYINSGVLVIDLDAFRKYRIAEKFLELLSSENFDTVAPDQDYLNFLCHGKIKYLPLGWNKQPSSEIDRENLHLIHYNFYKKPWHYSDVLYQEEFWRVADTTDFAEQIRLSFNQYTDEERAVDIEGGVRLLEHAAKLAISEGGFKEKLGERYFID